MTAAVMLHRAGWESSERVAQFCVVQEVRA